jgi:hypothetical protein
MDNQSVPNIRSLAIKGLIADGFGDKSPGTWVMLVASAGVGAVAIIFALDCVGVTGFWGVPEIAIIIPPYI